MSRMPAHEPAPPRALADDGAWCWFADPRGVHHRGHTYLGWVNSAGDIVIGDWPDGGPLTTHTLRAALEVDDHANPSVLIRPDGRLIAFYTAHGGAAMDMHYRVSARPLEIAAWGPERTIPDDTPGRSSVCYPTPIQLADESDRIYLFYRGHDFKPNMTFSDDGGQTWADVRTFIEGRAGDPANRPYCKFATDGRDRFDVAFTTGHPRREPQNHIYYARYEGGALRRADGSRIGTLDDLPLTYDQADVVYDAAAHDDQRAWIWDTAIAPGGAPVMVFAAFTSETAHHYHYATWDGGWRHHRLCDAGGWFPQTPAGEHERELHYSGGIVLDHADPSIVYLSRPIDGVYEIERWRTPDAGRTWTHEPLTRASTRLNVRPFVVRDHPPERTGLIWMRGRYVHFLRYATQLWTIDP